MSFREVIRKLCYCNSCTGFHSVAYLYEKQYSHRLELEGVVREGQFELGEGVGTQQDLAFTFYDQLKQ